MRKVLILDEKVNVEKIDELLMEISNYGLTAVYKIGVYGKIRQNEIFIKGSWFDYLRFRANYDVLLNNVKIY